MDTLARDRLLRLAGIATETRAFDKNQLRNPRTGEWIDTGLVKRIVSDVKDAIEGASTHVDWRGIHVTAPVRGQAVTVTVSPVDLASLALLAVPGYGEVGAAVEVARAALVVRRIRRALAVAKAAEAVAGAGAANKRSAEPSERHRLLALLGVEVRDYDPALHPHAPAGPHGGQFISAHGIAAAVEEILTDDDAARDYGDELDRVDFTDDACVVARSEGALTVQSGYGDGRSRIHSAPGPTEAQEWASSIDSMADQAGTPGSAQPNGLVDFEVDGGLLVGYDPAGRVVVRWVDDPDPQDLADAEGFELSPDEAHALAGALRDMAYVTEDHATLPEDEEVAEPEGDETPLSDARAMRDRQLRLAGIETRDWDPADHPRNPKGGPGGGRFLSVTARILGVLEDFAGDDAVLKEFTQPQLRKAVQALGLTPKPRGTAADLRNQLLNDARQRLVAGKPNPVTKAAPKAPKLSIDEPDLDALRELDDPEAIRDALDLHKVPELQTMLGAAGLKKSGRKRELVDRLVEHVHGGKADTAPAAAEEKARVRQADIDHARGFADVAGELDELLNNGADPAVVLRGIDSVARRGGLTSDLKPIRDAIDSGDTTKARSLMDDLLKSKGVRQVGKAGDSTHFDRKAHEALPGTRLRDGAAVEVVRPGFVLSRDGEDIRLSKATVEEVDAPAKAAPATKTAPGKADIAKAKREADAEDAADRVDGGYVAPRHPALNTPYAASKELDRSHNQNQADDALEGLTLAELREVAKGKGLTVSGRNAEAVRRQIVDDLTPKRPDWPPAWERDPAAVDRALEELAKVDWTATAGLPVDPAGGALDHLSMRELKEVARRAGLPDGLKSKPEWNDAIHAAFAGGAVPTAAPKTPDGPVAKPVSVHDLFKAETSDATIETALRDVFEGSFGPYTTKAQVKVTRAGTRVDKRGREHAIEPSISIEGKVYDEQGNEIGNFGRSISPVERHYTDGTVRREVWAEHHIVQLGGGDYDDNPTKYHGKGFGGAFNGRAIEWYRASGVHGIHQSDHNGYVWASQGFDFSGGIMPEYKAEELRSLIADLRAGRTKDKYGETIPKQLREAPNLDAQIAAAEELLTRLGSTQPGQPGYPTAYEVSQLGRRPGQRGKTATWLGKFLKVPAEEMILNPDEGEVISQ